MIGGEGGRHVAELSFPLSVDRISCAPPIHATYHPRSCGGHGADCGNTQGPETNLKPLGRPAVDLHNGICSIHSTGKDLCFTVPLFIHRHSMSSSAGWSLEMFFRGGNYFRKCSLCPRWTFVHSGMVFKTAII